MYTVQRASLQHLLGKPFALPKALADSCMILAQTRYTFSRFEPKFLKEAVSI